MSPADTHGGPGVYFGRLLMRRWLLFPLLFLVTACQVDAVVDVSARGDGSGQVAVEVRLDDEGAATVPDLENQLRVDDLEKSGWSIDVAKDDGGEVVIRATQGFENEEQANAVLGQLSAGGGPFRNFELTQSRGLIGVETTFGGTVDLTNGIASFGDPQLQQRLGSPFGFDINETGTAVGVERRQAMPVTVRFSAPGSPVGESSANNDGEWAIPYGQTTVLAAAYEGADYRPLLWGLVAGIAVIAALVILFITRPGRYRPKHASKDGSGIRARDLIAAG